MATKDIVPVSENSNFLVLQMDNNELQDIVASALGTETLSPNDLQRVRLPAGGGQTWELVTADGEESVKTFQGVIIAQRQVRVYWKEEFSGEKNAPDCYSDDAVQGHGDPGILCERCPNAEFGSGKGKSQACQLKRVVFFLRDNALLPSYIALPPTSQAVGKSYVLQLASLGLMPWDVVTEFSLEKATSDTGIAYSRVKLARVHSFSPDEKVRMRAYADEIRPNLLRTRMAVADIEGYVDDDDSTGHGMPSVAPTEPVGTF
jgi:hypothetical protein